MRNVILTIWFVVLIFSRLAIGVENKIFYSSGQILSGEEWMDVYVYNDSTIVDMLGGTIISGIVSYNASTVNIIDGHLDGIGSFNTSTVNVSGGHVNTLDAQDFSRVNVSGGYVYGLVAMNNSTVSLYETGSGMNFGVEDWSTLNISGGTLNYLWAMEQGTLNISNGVISDSLGAGDLSTVNIFGNNLTKIPTGGNYGYGRVSGYWENGDSFLINLYNPEAYSHINLIPEPASLALFALGSLDILRRRKR